MTEKKQKRFTITLSQLHQDRIYKEAEETGKHPTTIAAQYCEKGLDQDTQILQEIQELRVLVKLLLEKRG